MEPDSTAKSASLKIAVRDMLAPLLREHGFKGTGYTYKKQNAGFIHVVTIQKNKWGGNFAINFGVHPNGIPTHMGETLQLAKAQEYDCAFRRRLSPNDCDKWWSFSEAQAGMNRAMKDASDCFLKFGVTYFQALTASDSIINTLRPEDLTKKLNRTLSLYPLGYMASVFANLREQQNRLAEAEKFAAMATKAPNKR